MASECQKCQRVKRLKPLTFKGVAEHAVWSEPVSPYKAKNSLFTRENTGKSACPQLRWAIATSRNGDSLSVSKQIP